MRIRFLEMTDPAQLRSSGLEPEGVELRRVDPPDPQLNRQLYSDVGRDWHWRDWLVWTTEQWQKYADRPELETWIAQCAEQRVGYFELERQPKGSVQIMHLGLFPAFVGRGLGGWLLTEAVRRAWALPGTRRVWLHTCSNDHPHALDNYRARGFRIYKSEED